jgi:transposase
MTRGRARQLGLERGQKQVQVAWTEAEEEVIRKGVAAGETCAQIAERLPGRTLLAVKARRVALREGARVKERWTEAEDAALREGLASGKSWKEIAKAFPGRTETAATIRRFRLTRGDGDASG